MVALARAAGLIVSTALSGSLRDFGIGEIFQLIAQQAKSGVLDVSSGKREIVLRFSRGRIVSAAPVDPERPPLAWKLVRCGAARSEVLQSCLQRPVSGVSLERLLRQRGGIGAAEFREVREILTRDTLFSLFRWQDGTFQFVSKPVQHRRLWEDLLDAEEVLSEGSRMVAEWNAFAASVPSPDAVFRRLGSPDDYRSSATAEVSPDRGETERVLAHVDGLRTAQQVVDRARVGFFQGTRALLELRRSGWIEEVGAAGPGHRPPGEARSGFRGMQLANALSGVVFLAALGWAWWPAGMAGSGATLPLARDAVGEALAQVEAVRLRNALGAYRLAAGHWPGNLAALGDLGLTFGDGDPHYFAVRDGVPVVLAPEL